MILLIHFFTIFPKIKDLEYQIKKEEDWDYSIDHLDLDHKILNLYLPELESFNEAPFNYRSKIFNHFDDFKLLQDQKYTRICQFGEEIVNFDQILKLTLKFEDPIIKKKTFIA